VKMRLYISDVVVSDVMYDWFKDEDGAECCSETRRSSCLFYSQPNQLLPLKGWPL